MQNKTATASSPLAIGLYAGTAVAVASLFVLLAIVFVILAKYNVRLAHKCRDCCMSSRQRELEA